VSFGSPLGERKVNDKARKKESEVQRELKGRTEINYETKKKKVEDKEITFFFSPSTLRSNIG
jgi:hypothetical protein